MTLTNIQLGEVGQDQFKLLVSSAGMVANGATQDVAGWDFVVEFQPSQAQGSTYDNRAGFVSVYVQVKTTTRSLKPSVRLSLSAAELLAKRPGPSFIVALAVEPDSPGDFDVHVIEMIDKPLADVLKALRQLHVSGRKANRSSITFRLGHANRLPDATGKALHARLNAAVFDGEDAYLAKKKEQREMVGFGRWAHEATIHMRDVTMAQTLDILLGRKEFNGAITDVTTTRFGIKLKSDALPSGEGLMKLVPEGICETRLKVRSKSLQRPLTFKGNFNHVSFPGPQGFVWKSRFDFGDFEVCQTSKEFQFNTFIPADRTTRPLDDWVKFYRLLATVNDAPTAFEHEVSGSIVRWESTPKATLDPESRARLDLFETALRLMNEVGLGSHMVSARDVFSAQKQIYAAVGFTLKNARSVRVTFVSIQDADQEFSTDRVYVGMIDLGAHRIAHAVRVKLEQLNPDQGAEWTTTTFRDGILQVIDRTPEAFRDFVEEAKQITGADSVLLDEIDAGFLNQALGECKAF